MTPLQIEILFWYYVRCDHYRNGDFSAPAVRDAITAFLGCDGLLDIVKDPTTPLGSLYPYRLTDRGRAYVNNLLAVPLPPQ